MAKNKNRDRNQQRKGAPAADRSQQDAQKSAIEAHAESAAATPGDMARKSREKRFGHN